MLTVEEWRKAKGLSIVKVAEALRVSPVTWARWEENPKLIPVGKADEFCKLVGANQNDVVFLP